jgi:MerR family copper efflux transcriptional regulator
MSQMTIGEAADTVGISAKAIRLWEAKGLLPGIARTPAGYRLFGEDHLAVLRFVHQAQLLGMTLGEIKHILDLQHAGAAPCTRVTQLLDARIAEIDRTLSDLTQLRVTLLAARQRAEDACGIASRAIVCHIIEQPNM